jgi:hypothetical protein
VVLLPKIALIYALHAVIMDHIYRTINLIAAFSASINPSCLMAPNRHRVTLSDPSGQVLARNALDSLETPHSLHSLRKSVCTAPSDRNQLSNGLATKGDGVVGSPLNSAQELGKLGLGLRRSDFHAHVRTSSLNLLAG